MASDRPSESDEHRPSQTTAAPRPFLPAPAIDAPTLRLLQQKLDLIHRISRVFLTVPDDSMYAEVLEIILDVTGSRFGYFGYIDRNGALVCPSMTRGIWDRCRVPDKDIVFPRNTWGGLWGRSLIEKRSLYANDDLHTPQGHIPLARALAVPILHRATLIGQLVVANRDTQYANDDRKLLEDVASQIAPVLQARLNRDQLERERRRAHVAAEHLARQLADKNEELESILYTTSHDLRSPLINIHGFSREVARNCDTLDRLLRQTPLPDDVRAQIDPVLTDALPRATTFITGAVGRLEAILDGLLRLSRLGRESLQIQPQDMNDLLARIRSSMQYQIEQIDASLHLEDLPPCLADAAQLTQVFSNLLENALKYRNPVHPLRIRVTGELIDDEAVFTIRDNGKGIPPEEHDRVFEIFRRLDDDDVGEGLGLTIARRIVHRHNGRIWLDSSPGWGTSVFVALPAAATA